MQLKILLLEMRLACHSIVFIINLVLDTLDTLDKGHLFLIHPDHFTPFSTNDESKIESQLYLCSFHLTPNLAYADTNAPKQARHIDQMRPIGNAVEAHFTAFEHGIGHEPN